MLYTLGKILIGLLFLISGCNLLMFKYDSIGVLVQGLEAHNIPLPYLVILAATILKILAGAVLIISNDKQYIRYAAVYLIVFTLLATYCYHFSIDDLNNVLKNMAIIGGLLLLL